MAADRLKTTSEEERAALCDRLGLGGPVPHLEQALTHPSFANEYRRGKRGEESAPDNQRLEFLGDAILGFCVSELLMRRFPEANEGRLSLMRASLVNAEVLASWARGRKVGAALAVGRGADVAGERDRTNVLADAVEAIVAAVYLDRGIEEARAFVATIVDEPAAAIEQLGPARDAKSELQEKVQAAGGSAPRYLVAATEGPDHDRAFEIHVEIDGEIAGLGRGRSKKLAEQAAARDAIEKRATAETPAGDDE